MLERPIKQERQGRFFSLPAFGVCLVTGTMRRVGRLPSTTGLQHTLVVCFDVFAQWRAQKHPKGLAVGAR